MQQWACAWQQVCALPLGLRALVSPAPSASRCALLPHSRTVPGTGVALALARAEAVEF